MRVMIIGSGGREHALVWKLKQNSLIDKIIVAPGNGGTESEAENINISDGDIAALVAYAKKEAIDLVIPGPELPLTLGIVDAMQAEGIACFGPSKYCARLEASKSFAKEIMAKANVPTAACEVFTDYEKACAYVKKQGTPIVIKADGLAGGKGVVVALSEEQALEALQYIMQNKELGAAGDQVVIEEFLEGEEVSLLCFCDGKTALPLPSAQDHKAVFDHDKGPNTGGMGAYSPAPVLPDDQIMEITKQTCTPILREMEKQGHPFVGILYAGLMITKNGIKVLEYNVRFGDPECQPLLMRLESDLVEIIQACLEQRLDKISLKVKPQAAIGVVLTGLGYPAGYAKGMEITGLEAADNLPEVKVFLAGAKYENNKFYASGGRILCATALGEDLKAAKDKVYQAMELINMDKGHYRRDIGDKGLKRLGKK